jgi:hypothetical protein
MQKHKPVGLLAAVVTWMSYLTLYSAPPDALYSMQGPASTIHSRDLSRQKNFRVAVLYITEEEITIAPSQIFRITIEFSRSMSGGS